MLSPDWRWVPPSIFWWLSGGLLIRRSWKQFLAWIQFLLSWWLSSQTDLEKFISSDFGLAFLFFTHDCFIGSVYIWIVILYTENWQEGSDSERESSDAPGSQKSLKRKRGKVQLSFSKDSVQYQSTASNDGCLSLLKRRHFDCKLLI